MKKKLDLKKETVLALNGYKGGIRETMISQCMADHTQVDCALENTELCATKASNCNCPTAETCNGASCQPTLCVISQNPAGSCMYCPGTADCLTKGNMCAN